MSIPIDHAKLACVVARVGSLVWRIPEDTLELDRTATELLGSRRPIAKLDDLLSTMRDSARDRVVEALTQALRGAAGFEVDLEVDHDLAGARVLRLRGTVLFDGAGVPEVAVGAIQDVTELTVVRGRLAAVTSTLAAVTSTARDRADLVAHLGHELHTHLNAVVNLNRTLLEAEPGGERRDQIAQVQRSSEHLVTLVQEVLELASAPLTSRDVELATFDVRELLADVLSPFSPIAASQGIDVTGSCDPAVPQIARGDAGRLRRVLHHVLADAAGKTPSGSIAVRVRARPDESANPPQLELQFLIEASGFDQTASQGDRNLHRTIARQLTELMNGRFDAMASSVSIRLVVEPSTATPLPAELSVLVAEDNLVNQRVAGAMLQKRGYTTTFANNGHEAVEKARARPFDVVLMDVNMPVMDGLSATRELVSSLGDARPWIVAMTANALAGDRAACLDAGCDDYVSKPLTPDKLDALLRNIPRVTRSASVAIAGRDAIDTTALDTLARDLGPAFVARLVRSFDDDARALHVRLEQAIEHADANALVRSAHVLRVAAVKIGAHALGVRCSEIEAMARRDQLQAARPIVNAIGDELHSLREVLAPRLAG